MRFRCADMSTTAQTGALRSPSEKRNFRKARSQTELGTEVWSCELVVGVSGASCKDVSAEKAIDSARHSTHGLRSQSPVMDTEVSESEWVYSARKPETERLDSTSPPADQNRFLCLWLAAGVRVRPFRARQLQLTRLVERGGDAMGLSAGLWANVASTVPSNESDLPSRRANLPSKRRTAPL